MSLASVEIRVGKKIAKSRAIVSCPLTYSIELLFRSCLSDLAQDLPPGMDYLDPDLDMDSLNIVCSVSDKIGMEGKQHVPLHVQVDECVANFGR